MYLRGVFIKNPVLIVYIMKTLNLIVFSADNIVNDKIEEVHEALFSVLRKEYDINLVSHKHIEKLDAASFSMILISSGNVGNEIINKYENLPHPLYIVVDGKRNSLGVALEVLAWANSQSVKAEIIYGSPEDMLHKINMQYAVFQAQVSLKGKKIGVIGTPAKWLVSSEVNYLLTQRRWGVEFVDINQDDLLPVYEAITENEIDGKCEALVSHAAGCENINPDDVVRAVKFYEAMRRVIAENGLDAVTVYCMRIQKRLNTTSDVALSLLNNEGIPAGSEGDLQSIFTMLMLKELTGEKSFMGNVSGVDHRDNSILMSHCSISTDMTAGYYLNTHFESNSGVAVHGIMEEQEDVTVVKCGGECLDEYFVSRGTVMNHAYSDELCRTQIKVRLNEAVDYFLERPISNHHVLVRGNHEKIVNDFLLHNSCKRIR